MCIISKLGPHKISRPRWHEYEAFKERNSNLCFKILMSIKYVVKIFIYTVPGDWKLAVISPMYKKKAIKIRNKLIEHSIAKCKQQYYQG
jgi:hypothetical protein